MSAPEPSPASGGPQIPPVPGPPIPRPSIALLVTLTALSPLAINIVVPSLPGLVAAFGTDYGTAQLTLTLYLVGVAVGQLMYGPLSDRYGRRPLMIGGHAVFVAASVLCLVAPTIDVLILGRVGQALGGCSGIVLSRAIIRDVFDRERSASVIGYVTMGMALGPMIAPALGGVLDEVFGWRGSYWFMLGYGVVALGLAVPFLRETNVVRGGAGAGGALVASYRRLLSSSAFLGYAWSTAFNTGAFFGFLAAAPYLTIEVLKLSPTVYGVYFIVISVGYMLGNFLSGRLSTRLGVERMVLTGNVLSITSGVVTAVLVATQDLAAWIIFGPMVLHAVGSGLILPNALAAGVSVDPRAAGSASGTMGFLQMSFSAVVTVVVAHAQDGTAVPLVVTILSMAILTMVSFRLGAAAQRREDARRDLPDHGASAGASR